MQSHTSRVRTPKEMDAYIDRVYDLLAESEEVAKVPRFSRAATRARLTVCVVPCGRAQGRLSVAVPPFTTTLTELTVRNRALRRTAA